MLQNNLLDELGFNQNANKVFVYIVELNNSKHHLSRFWNYLTYEEKSKATKYFTNNLRDTYIISHGTLRYILSYYTGQLPQDIEFIYNKYNKPFLKNNNNINFNMSHSHEIVSYIIALDHNVGIDIELRNKVLNIEEFVNLALTPAEYMFFSTLEKEEKISFFFDQWTKKEALVKAYGKGLSYPINTLEVMGLLSGENIILGKEDDESKQKLYYFPLEIQCNYSGSIAVEYKIDQIIYPQIMRAI